MAEAFMFAAVPPSTLNVYNWIKIVVPCLFILTSWHYRSILESPETLQDSIAVAIGTRLAVW